MKRSTIETVLGAGVLLTALIFIIYTYNVADLTSNVSDGYEIHANFSTTGGLGKGAVVTISGVQVGTVQAVVLDPESYNARVIMQIKHGVKIPTDSSATITSESLMGGHILNIQPGADEAMLENKGVLVYTQAPQSLEELLGKFIFSVTESKDKEGDTAAPEAADAAPIAAPAPTPAPEAEAAPAPEAETAPAAEAARDAVAEDVPAPSPAAEDEAAPAL
ncbi:MAG: outer membrane lipid asymmetry maintenance protein MlaD [Pseudomonadota bacterium]